MHNDELIRVLDHDNLRRDPNSGAIIDVDTRSYNSYLSQREARLSQQAKYQQLEDRINNIDSDLSDIKTLLTRLLEK
jgi:predicted lipase